MGKGELRTENTEVWSDFYQCVLCCNHNDVCAVICTHRFTHQMRPHTQWTRRSMSCGWNTGIRLEEKYFTLSDQPGDILRVVSPPILIFPTTHHSFPRRFVNTPVPSGRRAPDWRLPGSGVLSRNSGCLWDPARSRWGAPTLLWAQPRLLCPAAAAPLGPALRETKQLNKNFWY